MNLETNKQLALIFRDMSHMYRYMGNEPFRSAAYAKAAKEMSSLTEDIEEFRKTHQLDELPGIGEGTAQKIEEFLKTGKIKKYEQLKKEVPYELMNMMEITGFGPKSLKRIHEQLHISTRKDLMEGLRDGSIAKMKGFGPRKVQNLLRGLKLHKTIEDRMLLWTALEEGERIISELRKNREITKIELAGSVRRKKESIGDIDILAVCDEKSRQKIIRAFCSSKAVGDVLAKGSTKASIILKDNRRQVDLRLLKEDEWGSALQYFTGSKEHNIHLRALAHEKGYKISEYGIFELSTGKKIGGEKEEDIYDLLGLQWMPPEIREDKGEIVLAAAKKIPRLVELSDMRGDLQFHSNWSDGANTIEEIALHLKRKYLYDYIAITDHSKSSRIAHGLDEKQILQQVKAIELVNQKLGASFMKTGIEVDILPDGGLDISNEILSQLDWVTASVHSNFNMDNTDRLIKACESPFVHCIGHPTGRMIGTREPYRLNIEKLMEAAKHTGTALEINAQPERMDLNDELARIAKDRGVKLVISTDSHSLPNFAFMTLGVSIARRAWCTKENILNTGSWKHIEQFKKRKTKKDFHNA